MAFGKSKKKWSLLLVFVFCFSLFFSLNSGFAFNQEQDTSTVGVFLTNSNVEKNSISELIEKKDDVEFIKENKIIKVGLDQLKANKIKLNEAKSIKDLAILEEDNSEALFISGELFSNNAVIALVKRQLNSGKTIYFYGKNLNLEEFSKKFELENTLPKEVEKNIDQKVTDEIEGEANITEEIIFLGVTKEEWGNTLITATDFDYNFYRTVDYLLKDAVHNKKLKVEKPYETLTVSKSSEGLFKDSAEANDIDYYPIKNHQRKVGSFNSGHWYLITDLYLHRQSDSDTTNDYFILETISELNASYDQYYTQADQFYTKLKPYYTDDIVRAGGPPDQGGTTNVNVTLTPPYISFAYQPGGSVSVDSTFSLTNNQFYAYFKEASIAAGFNKYTIHRTQLSFKNYAPSSSYTYVKTKYYQGARAYNNQAWFYAWNPATYNFDY